MPIADPELENKPKLPFPPIPTSHILHCSVHFWYPRYRSLTPKSRLVPLSPAFVAYLRADGIVLPPEPNASAHDEEFESEIPINSTSKLSIEENEDDSDENDISHTDDEDDDEISTDPSTEWPEIHSAIASTITELGGKVLPKLNWSAPKDATWINATNSMECRSPNDIYMLLKSSDFVTHDLEHAFDGCIDDGEDDGHEVDLWSHNAASNSNSQVTTSSLSKGIPYTLVLRKAFALNPSVEFRCFVRHKSLLAISQRSVNHFEFLFGMVPQFRDMIKEFFDKHVKDSFPDDNFTFDVYIPDPYQRVWLIDFNPWAPRTDPLLFSWMELLGMEGPEVNLVLRTTDDSVTSGSEDEPEETVFQPEFRLIKKDDPEAYSFNTPQYSAHKLPRDVVEASQAGPGPLREFAEQWKDILNREQPAR